MRLSFLIVISAFLLGGTQAHAESPIRPGDRVAIMGNTFADQLRVHGYLETLLLQNSEENPVSIRNLGWGGDMLTARDRPTNFPSDESTLSDHKTDVIVACFGFGESFAGNEGLTDFKSDLEAFIASHKGKKYNGRTEVRLILVSPIGSEDLGELTPNTENRNGELQAYTQAIGEVAKAANLPFVDLYEQSRYLMNEPGPDMTTNGVHLRAYGYWAISNTFANQLIKAESTEPWQIALDAKNASGDFSGVELVNIESKDGSLNLKVKELSAPSLRPPTDETLPPQLSIRRDTLVVKNLKAGSYTLTIDGKEVASGTNTEWDAGVPIDSSPAHLEAEAYRELVNDKNLQFVYSWKALNQVHIVGERKTSASGSALPAEVIKFNEITKERDEALGKGIELKTREWKLTPTAK